MGIIFLFLSFVEALDVHGLTTQHRVQQNSVGLAKRDDGLRPVKAAGNCHWFFRLFSM